MTRVSIMEQRHLLRDNDVSMPHRGYLFVENEDGNLVPRRGYPQQRDIIPCRGSTYGAVIIVV